MSEGAAIERVLVTGATGFVGKSVIRELLARGYTPVCLVRSPGKLRRQHPDVNPERFVPVVGGLSDRKALRAAAQQAHAVIHLVGIIIERRLQGQTFEGVHARGTSHVVEAAVEAGIKRFVHMSALGARPDAPSKYHRTKWAGEQSVRQARLDWTIFRPSLIHGPEGEFMSLMKKFVCDMIPPVIPYFGSGEAKLQPVYVKDVAHCFVDALNRPETIGQIIPLGGPNAYSWKALYETCRALLPGAKKWKPIVSQPVPVAKVAAVLSAPVMALGELAIPSMGLLRFDRGQVDMSQEDSVCDHTIAEKKFGIKVRNFETELSTYADQIN